MNVVILQSSGLIIRYGTSDFENDGAFDAATEEQRSDCPFPPLVKGEGPTHHHWTGAAWEVIDDTLSHNKATRTSEIDARTEELITGGFLYATKVFSLSEHAQTYWNGLGNMVSNGLLTEPDDFPIEVNTLDDLDTYNIVDIADTVGFFATAAATVKAHLESGTVLKNSIRAAANQAALDAVVDTR